MSSGNRHLFFPTRGRSISTDKNRAQAFGARELAEVLRRLVDMRATAIFGDVTGGPWWDFQSGFVDTTANDGAAISTPMKGDIFEGLCVLPQVGGLNLRVSPGAVGLDDPDGESGSSDPDPPSSDDSRYKVVISEGVVSDGDLVITAGGVSARLDVVECRRVPAVVLETSSRAIFDPGTGQPVATPVDVVQESQLEFRVRAGTPGSTTLTFAQGWLPLAVAFVPASASAVEQMRWWDVRDLVDDRVAPGTSRQYLNPTVELDLFAETASNPGECRVAGRFAASLGMGTAGGVIRDCVGNLDYIDAADVAFQAAGYTPVDGDMWHLYAVFPFGLRRWVEYDGSPLLPTAQRGILSVSQVAPLVADFSLTGVSCPASTGIGGSHLAFHVASGIYTTALGELGFQACAGENRFGGITNTGAGPTGITVSPASSSGDVDRYNLVAGTHFPADATHILVVAICTLTGANDAPAHYSAERWQFFVPGGSVGFTQLALGTTIGVTLDGSGNRGVLWTGWIPIPRYQSFVGFPSGNAEFNIDWTHATRTGGSLTICGFRRRV